MTVAARPVVRVAAGIAAVVGLLAGPPRIAADPTYDATITSLASEETVSLAGLWDVKAFMALSSKGRQSVDDAISFLANGAHSDAEKRMAIISMYPLPVHEYCAFLKELVALRGRNAVDDDMLALAVTVPAAFSVELQKNYRGDEVRNALEAMKSQSGIASRTQAMIADILSGRTWSRTQAFCRNLIFTRDPNCRNLGILDLF